MESLNPWKLIKAGFWIGIGFIIPSVGIYILGTYLIYSTPFLWQTAATESSKEMMENFLADNDKVSQLRIVQFREVKHGKQLLILGTIENTGESSLGSIRIEAELLDGEKQMVFECSEYLSKRLKTGEKENFQVKCGCGNQPAPDYKSVNLRVVSASNY